MAGSDRRVRSTGGFELPLPAVEAFDLFTAKGEQRWIPGWSPEILGQLPQHPGLVFLTEAHGHATIWTVIESDPEALCHRYSRVTPGHTAGTVEVRLRPAGSACSVSVSYDMTALADDHAAALAPYTGEAFQAMLADWQALILAAIGREAAQA
jgi:hypothetical protein